jgi:hypothetical protein
MTGYILCLAEHEGKQIIGLFTKEEVLAAYKDHYEAIEKARSVRELLSARYGLVCPWDNNDFARDFAKEGGNRKLMYNRAEDLCIMKADQSGAKCSCAEFGLV